MDNLVNPKTPEQEQRQTMVMVVVAALFFALICYISCYKYTCLQDRLCSSCEKVRIYFEKRRIEREGLPPSGYSMFPKIKKITVKSKKINHEKIPRQGDQSIDEGAVEQMQRLGSINEIADFRDSQF